MQIVTGRFVSCCVVILICFALVTTSLFAEDIKYPKSWDNEDFFQQKRDSGKFAAKREILYEWDVGEVHDYLEFEAFGDCLGDTEAHKIFGFTRAQVISDLGSSEEFFARHIRQAIINLEVRGFNEQLRSMSGRNFNKCLRTHTLVLCPAYYGDYLGLEEGRVRTFCE